MIQKWTESDGLITRARTGTAPGGRSCRGRVGGSGRSLGRVGPSRGGSAKRLLSVFLPFFTPPPHTLSHARKRRGNRHTAYNLPFNPCSFPGRPARAGHPKGWACTVLPEGCGDGYGNSRRSEAERGGPAHHVHAPGCWSPEILKGRLNFAREFPKHRTTRRHTAEEKPHFLLPRFLPSRAEVLMQL